MTVQPADLVARVGRGYNQPTGGKKTSGTLYGGKSGKSGKSSGTGRGYSGRSSGSGGSGYCKSSCSSGSSKSGRNRGYATPRKPAPPKLRPTDGYRPIDPQSKQIPAANVLTIAPPEQGYTPLFGGGAATSAAVPPVQIPQTVPGVGPTPSAQPGNQPGGGLTPVPTTQVPGAGSSSGGLGLADLRLPTVDELRQLPGQIDGALHDPNLAANIAQALNDPDVWVEVGAVVVSTVAVGAICAGTAGIGCAVTAGMAVGAVVAGGSYAAKQAIHHEEITAGGLATHVVLGGAGGALGGAVGYGGGKAVQAIAGKLGKQAANIAEDTAPRFSRFAVDSSGETTMFLRAGKEALEVTEHAAQRALRLYKFTSHDGLPPGR